ncbi:hypothetical protein C5O00_13830 [Pukyongia salina]|uniref:Uncharacterized protein n=1 Tax=Pukyongia salina TaxID=2094025 RepID=A0A2S0I021_9FLAO|nr:DUF6090 family protein [Pukyongia salina]AVI52174.1 hypothetical protein C5O00_13830 [Pukyongia salina]
MIKFFRKIRQSLLTENKFRKYLIYAIGEIVLVVIGILIALQINNYNQERIIKEQNQIVLQNLNKEFKENLIELDVSIDRLNSVIEGLDRLLLLMRTQDSNMTNLEFDQLLNKTFWMPNWKPSSFVLVELKNSGALSNLNNNNLKSLLFKWEREFDQMENNNANFKQYGAEYIEFITKNGSVRNIDALTEGTKNLQKSTIAINNPELLKNPEFENRADNFYFLSVRLRGHFQSLSELMKDIIENSNE